MNIVDDLLFILTWEQLELIHRARLMAFKQVLLLWKNWILSLIYYFGQLTTTCLSSIRGIWWSPSVHACTTHKHTIKRKMES